jgi:mannose-6-phosphate isomerase-like protein (cupin superfamily)
MRKEARPYHLKRDEGRTYDIGIDVTVKAGEARSTNGAAVFELVTRKGEEPGDHVHETEDEMFYVVDGQLTFVCNGQRFAARTGGFVFLPRGLSHNYIIRSRKPVRLLVITAPPRKDKKGWRGFVGDVESSE